jgi:chromosome segregation ATPase
MTSSIQAARTLLPLALATALLCPAGLAFAKGGTAIGQRDHFSYAVLSPESQSFSGMTDQDDWKDLRRMLDESDETLFWFRLDGREYLVQDRAAVERAVRIVEPMQELGGRQGELGSRQGALGAKQGRIGSRQGLLGGKQARLNLRLQRIERSLNREHVEDRAALRAEQRGIEDELESIETEMEELSRQMEPLSREQEVLGREQSRLGKLQEAAGEKAAIELERLAKETITAGSARRRGR